MFKKRTINKHRTAAHIRKKIESIAKCKHVCATRGSGVHIYYFIIAKTKIHSLKGQNQAGKAIHCPEKPITATKK